jgi:flagellar motor switch protein FliN/FliY
MTNDMTQHTAEALHKSLLEEYSAELTPTADKAAATQSKIPAAEARGGPERAAGVGHNLDMVMRIPVTIKIVLGSATMPVANLVKLGRGAVIPLDRKVGDPVDMMVNGRLVARGEVVVVDESTSRFGIKITEVVGSFDNDKPL